jgi:4'-phosphopantetheinyl transferase
MQLSLPEHQVSVFYGNISDFQVDNLLPVLSEKEIARSEKYLLLSDKHNYMVSRAILKRLLSRFSSVDESKIELDYNKNGKPFLPQNSDLQFNSSHSGNAFAIAFNIGNEMGIDIESLSRIPNIQVLETRLFTPAELKLFQTFQPDLQRRVFINSWTRKEAMLKAGGDGLTRPMNELEVSFITENYFHLGKENEQTQWFLESTTLMGNYRVSVAVKGDIHHVKYFPVNESELLFE